MAYDPYKSLLANASRDHVKRSADLNTHLVGNVFLPAIDSQHKQKPSTSIASLKHLKVIEQCIMAENKREQRVAKCATIKERRIMAKKFQAQRERERELIQALMLGNYPELHHDIKFLETEVVAEETPQKQLNQEITGLCARVATPDRVFRKADITGGVPNSKPHIHQKFKLPECNGSPGRKASAKAQDAVSLKFSSPPRQTPPSSQAVATESPTPKKRSPSRSAKSESSVRSPKTQLNIPSESTTAVEVETAASPQSPYISLHRHQATSAKATAQLSSLPNKAAETISLKEMPDADAKIGDQQPKKPSVSFEGEEVTFSEAQRLAETMGSDAHLLKEKCERILAEMATQTTPRVLEDALDEDGVKKTSSRPELPPMDPSLVATLNQDASSTTPRRPQSDRTQRSTRQSFLASLGSEDKVVLERREAMAQQADKDVNVEVEATHENETLAEDDKPQVGEEESAVVTTDALDSADVGSAEEATHENEPVAENEKSEVGEEESTVLTNDTLDSADVGIAEEATHENETLAEYDKPQVSEEESAVLTNDTLDSANIGSAEEDYDDDFVDQDPVIDTDDFVEQDSATDTDANEDLETDVAELLFDLVDMVEAAIAEEKKETVIIPSPRTVSPRPRSSMDRQTKYALQIQSLFRGYRSRIAFRLALYDDALSCGVLGAMPGTIQGRSGWYLDPKRLMAYYFVIPDPDGEWEQKFTLRCSRLVLTPYEMRQEVLSKVPADLT